MKSTRQRMFLGLIAIIVVAALFRLPAWAGADQRVIPMIVVSMLSVLFNVYVSSRPIPARHRH